MPQSLWLIGKLSGVLVAVVLVTTGCVHHGHGRGHGRVRTRAVIVAPPPPSVDIRVHVP